MPYYPQGSPSKNTGVGCHSLLQWTTFCHNSSPWPVHLEWPWRAWLIASLSYSSPFTTTRLWSMKGSFIHCCYCLVAKSYVTLSNPMGCRTPGSPIFHYLLEFSHTHVRWVGDATQPSHPLLPPSLALNLSQYQGFVQWGSSHQLTKVLELQLQHQSFQWMLLLGRFSRVRLCATP